MKNLYSNYCSVKKSVVTTCNINRLFSSTGGYTAQCTQKNVLDKTFFFLQFFLFLLDESLTE